MSRRRSNQRLALLLAQSQLGAGELARAVNALGTAQGMRLCYDRTSVAHWLTGSRPRPAVAELVAAALGWPLERVVTVGDIGFDPVDATGPSAREAALRDTADLCRDWTCNEHRPADVVYRASRVPHWDRPVPADRSPVGGRRATVADVQALSDLTAQFAVLAERHGGARVGPALAACFATSVPRLLTAPASAETHRALLVGSARMAHVLATTAEDADHQGSAQRHLTTAFHLAREADDRGTGAIVLRTMSRQALRLGCVRQAADLADAAVDATSAHTPATRAFVLSQRAWAHAAQHHRRPALADLDEAEHRHEQAVDHPGEGPFATYPRPGFEYQRARILDTLGESGPALRALREAAQRRSPQQRRAHAVTLARLARAQWRDGDIEAAGASWHTFLDQYPHLGSTPVHHQFVHLGRLLHQFPRLHQFQPLRERVRGLAAR
ncbi:hypothetical protein B4N89_30540 [Embleya scabrispora]|uniref:Transcriptional regulator n=1 Tax=Embleya scabrispora TaxID=159449 RepID=A0A1T3P6L3_9ACTN|nr:hypothetical protein [Embleya scabrispora]OPC84683.1 hypothetical protein B4N89_30540 [Embleya scabrispora]